jgi:mRNA interferase RelE/StbE
MNYKVEVETRARREYRDLPSHIREQIADAIDDLQLNPHPPGAKKLVGKKGYRIRTGDCRILYAIEDQLRIV